MGWELEARSMESCCSAVSEHFPPFSTLPAPRSLLAIAAQFGTTLPVVTIMKQAFQELLVFQGQSCFKMGTRLIESNVSTLSKVTVFGSAFSPAVLVTPAEMTGCRKRLLIG